MLKKIFFTFSLLLIIYLIIPGSTKIHDFKPLPDSVKSNEPGDTVQMPNIAAYFTDYRRLELIPFYEKEFSEKLKILGFNLPFIKLNHPPQYANEVIRPLAQGWYLEEFVHPLRESLYVNGWEPFDEAGNKRTRFSHGITVDGRKFTTKVTLRYYISPVWARLATGLGIITAVFFLYRFYIKALSR